MPVGRIQYFHLGPMSFEELAKARVIAPVFHSACSGAPLHADINWKSWLYLVGQLGRLLDRLRQER